MLSNHHFDVLMSKIIFLKKYYFDGFPTKKHFEKQAINRYYILKYPLIQ
jgi:ssDNA-specific exonuclease RecJ